MPLKPLKKARKTQPKAALIRAATRDLRVILSAVLSASYLRRRSGLLASGYSADLMKIDFTFINSPAMRKLNGQFRGKDQVTDILSFPAPPIFRQQGHLGDLVICLNVLRAQARAGKISERSELRVLLVHGVLHLLGFDHEVGRRKALQMESQEADLLAKFSPNRQSPSPGLISRARAAK